MPIIFHETERARVPRSVFDLSHAVKYTADLGELIPVCLLECVPGDIFQIGYQAVARFTPLITPIMSDFFLKVESFFVPYRLLMNADTLGDAGTWEDFITGGRLGTSAPALPTWTSATKTEGSLWDYLYHVTGTPNSSPSAFPLRAYRLIYNEYYRDQNVQAEVDITTDQAAPTKRHWARDYFTSCLPWEQRGTAGSLPITLSGTLSYVMDAVSAGNSANMMYNSGNDQPFDAGTKAALEDGTIDLSAGTATSIDMSDLRLQFQIQRWLERNARAGGRYEEFLRAHFGVSGGDARWQIPEFIGADSAPVIISEVLQTSATDTGTSSQTAQGEMTGHGIAAAGKRIGTYRCKEYGLIMTLGSVVPKAIYHEGIHASWWRSTKYNFYHPEFAGLSEQPVYERELYLSNSASEDDVFGYQGRYDELRHMQDKVSGLFHSTLAEWTIRRHFGASPTLGITFLECNPQKTIFADSSTDSLMVKFNNYIKAVRPLPKAAIPGGLQ